MLERQREANARVAANSYAPKPVGSSLLYGLIAVTLVGLAMIIFSIFYGANITAFPVIIGIILACAFTAGVMLRRRRRHLHGLAYTHEYDRQEISPLHDGT